MPAAFPRRSAASFITAASGPLAGGAAVARESAGASSLAPLRVMRGVPARRSSRSRCRSPVAEASAPSATTPTRRPASVAACATETEQTRISAPPGAKPIRIERVYRPDRRPRRHDSSRDCAQISAVLTSQGTPAGSLMAKTVAEAREAVSLAPVSAPRSATDFSAGMAKKRAGAPPRALS